jgi:hypothetical protein
MRAAPVSMWISENTVAIGVATRLAALFDKMYWSEFESFSRTFCALSQVQNLSKLIQSFNGMT